MKEVLEKHHMSYSPAIIELIPRRKHQAIHGNVPISNELNLKMRQYDKLVKLSVMLQNWRTSYEREFGQNPIHVGLEQIDNKKKEMLANIEKIIKNDLKKIKHIKGLGIRYLAGLLAYAHPERFRTLHKFLLYCGYKGSFPRYNRKVKSIVNRIAIHLIMCKDKHYYPLYLKIKKDLKKRFPTYKKGKIDGMAKNRLGTFLLKEVYRLFTGWIELKV